MTRPEYSVIVPAYQAQDVIGDCVRALNAQTVPRQRYEVIVVDDGSSDGTAAVARERGADRVLTCPHSGPAAARNAGTEAAQGEIVLFTDADCEPSPGWIEHMTAPFADPHVMGAKGTYHTRQKELIARLVQLEFEIRYERMRESTYIDFVDGYSAAYRRDILLKTGGFDPTYPVPSAEDVDLSFRLAQAGHRLVFEPQAWVWHRHPTSLKAYLARKGCYGFWRALLYLRYPKKREGDTHTDPALKRQFVLAAMVGGLALGGFFWCPLLIAAAGGLIVFELTTLPFIHWAWSRDRSVAVLWPFITPLRAYVQGTGLAVGLIYHKVITFRQGTRNRIAKTVSDQG